MPFTIGGEWVPEKEMAKKPTRPIKIIKERRGQSIVTLILNLPLEKENLKQLCSKMKQKWGCGGAIKEDRIEIQGEKISLAKELLKEEGYKIL